MWTSKPRRSYFIFVRIRKKGKGLAIPIFLPVLEITLDALPIWPGSGRRLPGFFSEKSWVNRT
ncbi:MAG: hypothetical protein A4E53_02415 [Pelotomaculum sp. PtaB.Bin104]|nr:MAG: hypothetical protein A4E53_02415 [Pelotomaculum sp. PtaB.Bin104]